MSGLFSKSSELATLRFKQATLRMRLGEALMPFSIHPSYRAVLFFLLELTFSFQLLWVVVPVAQAGGACPIPPNPEWTSTEKDVWEKLCKGNRATLSTPLKDGSISASAPIITRRFLNEIIHDFKYRKAIETIGVHITGAQINDSLDFYNAFLPYPLALESCRFNKAVSLRMARFDRYLSFLGSTFLDDLNLSSIRIDGTLVLEHGKFKNVNIGHSRVEEQILMKHSIVEGSVRMDSIKTGASVFLHSSTINGSFDLHASEIGFDVNIRDSTVGVLDLSRSRVHGSVLVGEKDQDSPSNQVVKTAFKAVNLNSAVIERGVHILEATIDEQFLLSQMRVTDPVGIGHSNLSKVPTIDVTYSDFGGLSIDHVYLPSLDLSGTVIHQPLELGLITWNEKATLFLRGTEIKTLIDDANYSWPNTLDLSGFVYSKFAAKPGTNSLSTRPTDWLNNWLSKQLLYTPQPYVQLASVLRSEGQREKADDILFESKERERAITQDIPTWAWLTAQKIMIGYGYHTILYTSLWAFAFALLGCVMLLRFQNPFKIPGCCPASSFLPLPLEKWLPSRWVIVINQFFATLIYSLDRFLPAVKLREHTSPKILPSGWLSYWFHFQQLMGYVVAAFFIAGLSGLIEK